MSLRASGTRENITRRAAMRLGGLRVVTSGGVSSGVDAALYLVCSRKSNAHATHPHLMLIRCASIGRRPRLRGICQ